MGEVINLNQVRKARNAEIRAREAARNRGRHGLSRAEREAARKAREREAGTIEGKRLPSSDTHASDTPASDTHDESRDSGDSGDSPAGQPPRENTEETPR